MRKDDVIKKSQKESMDMDEREKYFHEPAYGFAGTAMMCLAGVFVVAAFFRGENIWGYSALIFTYVSASNLYQYRYLKKKHHLVTGISGALVVIIDTILLFTRG